MIFDAVKLRNNIYMVWKKAIKNCPFTICVIQRFVISRISFNIFKFQVIKKSPSFAYKFNKSSLRAVSFYSF